MEQEYHIKSETPRSIMGRIPRFFLFKGSILATIILSAAVYLVSVVKIPFYMECAVYDTSLCNDGQMQGVVVIPKEWENDNSADIRVNRIGDQNYARAEVKNTLLIGEVGVIYIRWPNIAEDTASDIRYIASIIEYQKSVLFCIFEPLMQNRMGVFR